jgi:hypothetical protein
VLIVRELVASAKVCRASPYSSTEVQHFKATSQIDVFGGLVGTFDPNVESNRILVIFPSKVCC